jgi:hypothetical protein
MTDLELHDWALLRFGDEDLANKLAIVRQLHEDDPDTVLYLPDFASGSTPA